MRGSTAPASPSPGCKVACGYQTREAFVFEDRERGHTGSARVFRGYRSGKAIQEEDIRTLAEGLARFIVRVSQGRIPK